jgi:hypothetical protein
MMTRKQSSRFRSARCALIAVGAVEETRFRRSQQTVLRFITQ